MWPLPKRGRGPPSRQRQYEEALCRAIDQGVLPEEIVTKVVPVWWKQANPLKPLLPHWVGVALNELGLRDDVREFGWRHLFVPAGEDREAVIAAAQELHEEGKLFRPVGASCGGIPEEQPSDGEDPPAAAADEDGEEGGRRRREEEEEEDARVAESTPGRGLTSWRWRWSSWRSQWSSPRRSWGEPMEETPNEPGTSSTAAPKAAPPPKVDKKTALLQKLVGLRLAYGHKPPPGM